MRTPSPLCWTGCVLLGFFLLCPPKVCGQVAQSTSSSIARTFSLSFPVAPRHAVVVSAEYLNMESLPEPLAEQLYVKPAWRYKAIPITLGYSYALTDPNKRIVPVVGVGLSGYLGSVKQLDAYDAAPFMLHSGETLPHSPRLAYHQKLGIGYGAQVSLGVRADLHRNLFVLVQSRARYVNSLAFTTTNYDFHARFTRVDFAVGFGFKF